MGKGAHAGNLIKGIAAKVCGLGAGLHGSQTALHLCVGLALLSLFRLDLVRVGLDVPQLCQNGAELLAVAPVVFSLVAGEGGITDDSAQHRAYQSHNDVPLHWYHLPFPLSISKPRILFAPKQIKI